MTQMKWRGQILRLNDEENEFLRGLLSQQQTGEISPADCSRQAEVLLDAKLLLDAEMLTAEEAAAVSGSTAGGGAATAVQEEAAADPTPAAAFDLEEGTRRARQGMALAARALRVQQWKAEADLWLSHQQHGDTITADDLVGAVGLPDIEEEGQDRNAVLGAWFAGKSKQKRLVWEGSTVPSQRSERHGNYQRVWTVR